MLSTATLHPYNAACLLGVLATGPGPRSSGAHVGQLSPSAGSESEKGGALAAVLPKAAPALLSLLDFWLLFVALMLSLGAGVTVINNLSQMVGAFEELTPTAGVVSHSLLKLLACTNTLAGSVVQSQARMHIPRPITRTHAHSSPNHTHACTFLAQSHARMHARIPPNVRKRRSTEVHTCICPVVLFF